MTGFWFIIQIMNTIGTFTNYPWRGIYATLNVVTDTLIELGLKHANSHDRTHPRQWRNRLGTGRCRRALTAMALVSMSTTVQARERPVRWDTDSYSIGIDNRASYCISPQINDFVGPMTETTRTIKGFMGSTTRTFQRGTVKWKWDDDQGNTHTFKVPGTYYIPDTDQRLLSPQHWAQTQGDNKPIQGTGETTNARTTTLYWNQHKYKKTCRISHRNNVATFMTSGGYDKYSQFIQESGIDDETTPTCRIASSVMENEETPGLTPCTLQDNMWGNTRTEFRDTQQEENKSDASSATDELMRLHLDYNHMTFARLRTMANQGVIAKKYAKCPTPLCAACMYSKAIKRRKPNQTKNRDESRRATRPGEIISVDQLESPTGGFIAQIAGFLTKKRYKYATVYVDQFSNRTFVRLQKTSTASETIEGKKAFEYEARQLGIRIEHYHADNGIFKAKEWVQDCIDNEQGLTFCGVNAHHQNGVAEKKLGGCKR